MSTTPDGRQQGRAGRVVEWLQVIRGEFEEVPDLQVTIDKARQLWDLDASTLESILEALVDVGFLRRSPEGVYLRRREPAECSRTCTTGH